MKKLVFMLTVLLFATSTFAVAADQKVGAKVPVQMTDAEMGQVVGGKLRQPTIGSGYYLDYGINYFVYNILPGSTLSSDQKQLIESKLYCISSLFGGKRFPGGWIR